MKWGIKYERPRKDEPGTACCASRRACVSVCVLNIKGFEKKPELEENPAVKKEGRYIDKKLRNEDSRKLMLLNHSVLAEMIHTKKYVDREKVGREVTFKITPAGEYALHLSGKEV